MIVERDATRRDVGSSIEALVIGLTISRILIAIGLVLSYDDPIASSLAWLGLVVVADIADGVIARSLGVDSDARRMWDSTIDRACVHLAFLVFVVGTPSLAVFYVPLALRDGLAAMGSVACLTRRNALVLGGQLHKASSLFDALLGASFVVGNTTLVWLVSVPALAVNYLLLADYAGAYVTIWRAAPLASRSRVVIRNMIGLSIMIRAISRWGSAVDDQSTKVLSLM